VCFFWGTTYLGIRVALESFSPALLVCLRNLISGVITLSVAAMMGAHFPRGRDLWMTALYGLMIIGMGNGTLAVAEQWIPSGLASLFVTTSPFWFVGIDSLLPGGERLHAPTIRGLLLGFCGVLVLIAPAGYHMSFARRIDGMVTTHLDLKPSNTPHRPAADEAYLFALAVFTTWPRRLGNRRWWRVLHLGSVAGMALALVHAYQSGSDAYRTVFKGGIVVTSAISTYALGLRLFSYLGRRRASTNSPSF